MGRCMALGILAVLLLSSGVTAADRVRVGLPTEGFFYVPLISPSTPA